MYGLRATENLNLNQNLSLNLNPNLKQLPTENFSSLHHSISIPTPLSERSNPNPGKCFSVGRMYPESNPTQTHPLRQEGKYSVNSHHMFRNNYDAVIDRVK